MTPHQLRHTLATQAINRGMSLEAIAALLGHKSMRMTMVYAKIANRTVADEYFKVSEKVEALYDAPKELPADTEGAEMRKLRAEMHRRTLGNGYCARWARVALELSGVMAGVRRGFVLLAISRVSRPALTGRSRAAADAQARAPGSVGGEHSYPARRERQLWMLACRPRR